MSRYENERLGAPTRVLNHCLGAIAAQIDAYTHSERGVEEALIHARQTVSLLETVAVNGSVREL